MPRSRYHGSNYCNRSGWRVGFGFYTGFNEYYPSYYEPYFPSAAYIAPVPVVQESVIVPQPLVGVSQPVPTDSVAYPNGYAPTASAADVYGTTPAGPGPGSTPNGASLPKDQLYLAMSEGTRAFEQGEYDEAARFFLQVTMNDPDNVDGSLAYAVARFATGDYDLAATAIRRGIGRLCDVVSSGFDIRERYTDPKRFDDHYRQLAETLRADPRNVDAMITLGFVLHFSGQRDPARQIFEQVRVLSPDDASLVECFLNARPPENTPTGTTMPSNATTPAEKPY